MCNTHVIKVKHHVTMDSPVFSECTTPRVEDCARTADSGNPFKTIFDAFDAVAALRYKLREEQTDELLDKLEDSVNSLLKAIHDGKGQSVVGGSTSWGSPQPASTPGIVALPPTCRIPVATTPLLPSPKKSLEEASQSGRPKLVKETGSLIVGLCGVQAKKGVLGTRTKILVHPDEQGGKCAAWKRIDSADRCTDPVKLKIPVPADRFLFAQ